ncbi:MAG: glycosyltransferase family 39 protein, partial [Bacteroidota bacterium]
MSDRWQISGTRTSGCAAVGMALFYIVLAYLSRYYSLDEYNDSWDEATYILLGRGWLQGETLYVDIWDTKPPGIVWIAALVQVLFDNAVNGLRWLSMLSIGGTAYCIHRIGQHLFPKEPQLGVWAGIFYVFSISYVTFGFSLGRGTGMETNTEMFFIFFTCWGILRWLGDPEKLGRAFQGGLLLGIAFLIKYFVLFDMLAAGLLVVMLFWARYPQDRKQWFQRVVRHGGVMALGAVLPFGLLWGYYYFLSGNYDA